MARKKINRTMEKNEQGVVDLKPVELPKEPETAAEKAKRGRPVSTNKKPTAEGKGKKEKTPSVKSTVTKKMQSDVTENMKGMTSEEKEDMIRDAVDEQKNMTKQNSLLITSAISMSGISSEFRKSLVSMSADDIDIVAKARFSVQKTRIAYESKIRNQVLNTDDIINVLGVETPPEFVNIGADDIMSVPQWLYASTYNQELQLTKMLEIWSDTTPITRWMRDIVGVGPVFATILATQLKIDVEKGIGCAATDFINYVGLNDHNIPWIGKDKATKYVKDAYRELGMNPKDPVTWELCNYLSEAKDEWGFYLIGKKPKTIYDQCEDDNGNRTQSSLIKSLAKIPYNADLKSTMYLISKSFILNKNRGSKYGELYEQRLAYETEKNENGDYAIQAERALKTKNWDKSTESYKAYIKGKLPKSQLVRRASRYATKIFINHVYEAMYYDKYGRKAPWPYIMVYNPQYADAQHVHYIKPEVDYIPYLTGENGEVIGNRGIVTIHNVSEETRQTLATQYEVVTKLTPETRVLIIGKCDENDPVPASATAFGIPVVSEEQYMETGINHFFTR